MKRFALFVAAAALMLPAVNAKSTQPRTLSEAVRHELVMMPRYGIFDNLSYQVDGSTVVLTGEVAEPIVKADADSAVRHIEGVTKVVNNIEVLPLSPNDNRIRFAVLRAVYGDPTLSLRYGMDPSPSIHIIVKNGNVRLEGVVANQMDRNIAGLRAQGVFGAFNVENHLRVG